MATTEKSSVVRLAAIGDLHCTKAHTGKLQPLFAHVAEHADVLALCGDLTDYVRPEMLELYAGLFHDPQAAIEEYVASGDSHESVVRGLSSTARVIPTRDSDCHGGTARRQRGPADRLLEDAEPTAKQREFEARWSV